MPVAGNPRAVLGCVAPPDGLRGRVYGTTCARALYLLGGSGNVVRLWLRCSCALCRRAGRVSGSVARREVGSGIDSGEDSSGTACRAEDTRATEITGSAQSPVLGRRVHAC